MFKIFFVIFEGKWPWKIQKAGKLSFWLTCSGLLLVLGCGGGGGSGNDVNAISDSTDTVRLTVSSTTPSDGETNVAVNSSISANFSEAVDGTTINNTTFTVGGVTGTVLYSGTTATFIPSRNLSYSTTYTVTITRVKDLAGNQMTSSYSWVFTSEGGTAAQSGTATLTWDAPTTNIDGTTLTDLAGYKVYYGTSSGNYTQSIDVGNVTTYTVNNLSSDTYYFAVTAYNTLEDESGYSHEVNKSY